MSTTRPQEEKTTTRVESTDHKVTTAQVDGLYIHSNRVLNHHLEDILTVGKCKLSPKKKSMKSVYPSCYTEPNEMSPDNDSPRTQEFLQSLEQMSIAHKTATPLQEARCDAIVGENQLRIGGLFCLWCGFGPMSTSCFCPTTTTVGFAGELEVIPRWRIVHIHPCNLHNHCCPRSMCVGRCVDCGGCNMGHDECTHFNTSGGPLHPDPSNVVSLPLCPRTSEDKTRCYREYQAPVIEEEEDMDGSRPLVRPDNLRTALILTGGKKEEENEEEESEEEVEEVHESFSSKKKSRSKMKKKKKSSKTTASSKKK